MMADLVRTAKSGNDWSALELDAYNITIQRIDIPTFFGHRPGAIDIDPNINPNIFSEIDTSSDATHDLSPDTHRFLSSVYLATHASPVQQSAINNVARTVLEVMRFDEVGTCTCLRTCVDIPLAICGDNAQMTAMADICLVHINTIILLVVQEDRLLSSVDPEPQVIADAIAAFQRNNRKREEFGLEALQDMTILCITMIGTCPVFYKVPVTKELSHSVAVGRYPRRPTVVEKCWSIRRQVTEGMQVPAFRRTALEHYGAFHAVARECWTKILAGYHDAR